MADAPGFTFSATEWLGEPAAPAPTQQWQPSFVPSPASSSTRHGILHQALLRNHHTHSARHCHLLTPSCPPPSLLFRFMFLLQILFPSSSGRKFLFPYLPKHHSQSCTPPPTDARPPGLDPTIAASNSRLLPLSPVLPTALRKPPAVFFLHPFVTLARFLSFFSPRP